MYGWEVSGYLPTPLLLMVVYWVTTVKLKKAACSLCDMDLQQIELVRCRLQEIQGCTILSQGGYTCTRDWYVAFAASNFLCFKLNETGLFDGNYAMNRGYLATFTKALDGGMTPLKAPLQQRGHSATGLIAMNFRLGSNLKYVPLGYPPPFPSSERHISSDFPLSHSALVRHSLATQKTPPAIASSGMQASLVCVLISTNLVWFSRSARAPDRHSEIFEPHRHSMGPERVGVRQPGESGIALHKCCAGAVAGGRETRPRTWPTRGQLALSPPAMTLANVQWGNQELTGRR
ncbi:hypothetical protein NEUTE2DRAFT_136017 [Neurospora tetrasperma FGSC 2509]|nr:hypothetical protein NEUTE2DRAFT_136017 [Neurospora tetrasperma FGSC 2509]